MWSRYPETGTRIIRSLEICTYSPIQHIFKSMYYMLITAHNSVSVLRGLKFSCGGGWVPCMGKNTNITYIVHGEMDNLQWRKTKAWRGGWRVVSCYFKREFRGTLS